MFASIIHREVKNWTDSRLLNLELWFNWEKFASLLQDFTKCISCPSQKPDLERPTQYCRFLVRFSKHMQISANQEQHFAVVRRLWPHQYKRATRKYRLANILIVTVRVKTRSTVVVGYQLFGVTYGLNRQGQGGVRSIRTTPNQYTQWITRLLEQITVFRFVKIFPAFYGTWSFVVVFERVRHCSLP
jgi:hypothetical protein